MNQINFHIMKSVDYKKKTNNLFEALLDNSEDDLPSIKSNLANNGIDPDKLVSEGMLEIENILKNNTTSLLDCNSLNINESYDSSIAAFTSLNESEEECDNLNDTEENPDAN